MRRALLSLIDGVAASAFLLVFAGVLALALAVALLKGGLGWMVRCGEEHRHG
jgi:hypothetical protein